MKIRINRFAIFALAFTLGPFAANADPVEFEGHNYEVVVAPGITWQAASDAIGLLPPFAGVNGHLATITSAAEDAFIEGLRTAVLTNEAWVGGFQDLPCAPEPTCGWTWINGEGTFPGVNGAGGFQNAYSNWLGGEPNNAGTETHLAVGLFDQFGWNDEQALGLIGGYVVEYDTEVVVDVTDCLDEDGCELPGTTLVFPPSTIVDEGDVITVQSFEFDEIPGRCGVSSRVLFDGDPTRPNLHIPSWLCGSPKILILALDTSEVEFPDGVILVENDSPLPGNDYSCDSPDIPVGSDLRHQDVLGWQTTYFEDMVEHRYHADDPDTEFIDLAVPVGGVLGHMGEYTDGCSSTRGRVKGGSYYGIGLHIHPNGTEADHEVADPTPDNTLLEFHRIIRYKLALLQFSIIESKPALSPKDFKYMKKQAKQAIKQMNKGNFNAARAHVQNVERRAERAVYGTGDFGGENAEHLSRSANIIFMLDQKTSLP